MRIIMRIIATLAVLCCMLQTDAHADTILCSEGSTWHVGFGMREILPDENSLQPLYIARYNNGLEITGVLDYPGPGDLAGYGYRRDSADQH